MPRQLFPRTLQHWLTGLVLSALLATQWVAVVHGASGHGRHRVDAAVDAASASPAQGVRAVALAHDDGSALCKVLDHCLYAGPVPASPLDLGDLAPAPVALPAATAARLDARWGAYLARAPPILVPMHLA